MLRNLFSFVLLALVVVARVSAGVTIHYEGTAASPEAISKIMAAITVFAKENRWQVEDASEPKGKLKRWIDEKDKDYEGRITGVIVRVADNCEPLSFQFGDDLFVQDYVKTQFAGAGVHIRIVQLLELIRPYFEKIDVDDEGEYWGGHDRSVLEGHITKIDSVIADMKKKNPRADGPVRLKNGRILDIVQ